MLVCMKALLAGSQTPGYALVGRSGGLHSRRSPTLAFPLPPLAIALPFLMPSFICKFRIPRPTGADLAFEEIEGTLFSAFPPMMTFCTGSVMFSLP